MKNISENISKQIIPENSAKVTTIVGEIFDILKFIRSIFRLKQNTAVFTVVFSLSKKSGYREELLAEVSTDREAHGKKPLDDEGEPLRSGRQKKDNTSQKKRAQRKKEAKKQKTVTQSRKS